MVKIATFNVNGLAEHSKRNKVYRYIRNRKIDICVIQEMHSTVKQETIWSNQWGVEFIFSHWESNARGVMMLFRQNLEAKINKITKDTEGRVLIVDVMIDSALLTIMAIYAPNQDQPEFFIDMLSTRYAI